MGKSRYQDGYRDGARGCGHASALGTVAWAGLPSCMSRMSRWNKLRRSLAKRLQKDEERVRELGDAAEANMQNLYEVLISIAIGRPRTKMGDTYNIAGIGHFQH